MKNRTIILLALSILMITACEKKQKPLAPILPAASTQSDFLSMFPQTCIAGAKSIKIARVDEEELTVDQLEKGCSCAGEMLGKAVSESEWVDLVAASAAHKEPSSKLAGKVHQTLSECFEYAVGPQQ